MVARRIRFAAQDRENLFNQTDLVFSASTGAIEHELLTGVEFGRQETDNFRNTGYFNNVFQQGSGGGE